MACGQPAPKTFGVPLRERIAPWGHAPLRGSHHLVPSTLRSAATEDGRA